MGEGMRVIERHWYRAMREVIDEQQSWLTSKIDAASDNYDPTISADERARLEDEVAFLCELSESLLMRQMAHGWL